MDFSFQDFEGDSPTLQLLGKWGVQAYDRREMILMYIHLLFSAVLPIYIGSHASLRRPPSAATPEKSKNQDEEDDSLDLEPSMEGLTPSDAIMFPVLAGITLAGLYFIIKWMGDPALLNRILGWYFSLLGIFGVGKLAADFLNVATTFIFPTVWASRGQIYEIDPLLSQQVTVEAKKADTRIHRKFAGKSNPFPGVISRITFSEATTKKQWAVRALLRDHWVFRGYIHGIFSVRSKLQIQDVAGFILGAIAIILYNTIGKVWWLTNLIGFGFIYGTLQLMSPTTFWTGTLILSGLFIYDITMVFYTPLMVTVATSLDVPIKLVFPGPLRGSMLGLGDVVLPGIMMALALRFDLYLHYLRKQTKHTDLKIVEGDAAASTSEIVSAAYEESIGLWGERFWTHSSKRSAKKTVADGARFNKIYFKASVVGYVIAMLVTLVVLNVFNHAQPALLYLVPGVLVSLWGTALFRGELTLMWEYTEDGSLGEDESKDKEDAVKKDIKSTSVEHSLEAEGAEEKKSKKEDNSAHVFLFSLSSPKRLVDKVKSL